MNKNVDYAEVIEANDYMLGLAEHPDIPQADSGIIRMIGKDFSTSSDFYSVLDLGCGPGRLTKRLADGIKEDRFKVLGLDISKGFIDSAEKYNSAENVKYTVSDFLEYYSEEKFDCIFMQGSFHHIDLEKRKDWVVKIKSFLKPNGILIIGDEYVPDYHDDKQRIFNVAGLYSYVIAYAVRNAHESLATIECMNLIDDICSGKPGAGHSDNDLLNLIKDKSIGINEVAYKSGTNSKEYKDKLGELISLVESTSESISQTTINNNRGDYKISIEKQVQMFEEQGFALNTVLKYGPTDWLGGMGVVCFSKS